MIKRALILMILISLSIVAAEEINLSEINMSGPANVTSEINSSLNVPKITFKNIMPKEAKIGDIQLNLQVENTGNETFTDLGAIVTGNGFSTYETINIDSLKPGEKSYIFVIGNFKSSGNITLTMRIGGEVFERNISVIDESANQEKLEEIKEEQEKQGMIRNYSSQLSELKKSYEELESKIDEKSEDYDVSKISLGDLKGYIRNLESAVLSENIDSSKISLNLALEEYADLKDKVDNAKKRSLVSKLKENAVIFSTLAGALITFFALYELLKKKSNAVAETVHKVKEKTQVKKE